MRKFVTEQIQKQSKIGTEIQFTYTSYQKGLVRDAFSRVGVDPDDSTQARLLLFSMRKGSVTSAVLTEFDDLETQILNFMGRSVPNTANSDQKDREL